MRFCTLLSSSSEEALLSPVTAFTLQRHPKGFYWKDIGHPDSVVIPNPACVSCTIGAGKLTEGREAIKSFLNSWAIPTSPRSSGDHHPHSLEKESLLDGLGS